MATQTKCTDDFQELRKKYHFQISANSDMCWNGFESCNSKKLVPLQQQNKFLNMGISTLWQCYHKHRWHLNDLSSTLPFIPNGFFYLVCWLSNIALTCDYKLLNRFSYILYPFCPIVHCILVILTCTSQLSSYLFSHCLFWVELYALRCC